VKVFILPTAKDLAQDEADDVMGAAKDGNDLAPPLCDLCASPLHGKKTNATIQGAKKLCCGARRPGRAIFQRRNPRQTHA